MLFTEPFAEVLNFLKELELIHVRNSKPNNKFTATQLNLLGICITAMVLMGMFCFARIQRASGNKMSAKAFSWMLHYSKICWDSIFEKNVIRLLCLFGIKDFLVVDDTDGPS